MVGRPACRTAVFDGTVGSLIDFIRSSLTALITSSKRLLPVIPMTFTPGSSCALWAQRRIDALDGRDLSRWHANWSRRRGPGGKPRVAAARMAIMVLKAALSFGISCRLLGCADLKLILQQQSFAGPRPRTVAPTAAEIIAVRQAAHDLGHPSPRSPTRCNSKARCGNGTLSASGCRSTTSAVADH